MMSKLLVFPSSKPYNSMFGKLLATCIYTLWIAKYLTGLQNEVNVSQQLLTYSCVVILLNLAGFL